MKLQDFWGLSNYVNFTSNWDAIIKSDILFVILSIIDNPVLSFKQIECMIVKDKTGKYLPGQTISFSNQEILDFTQKYKLIYRNYNLLKTSTSTINMPKITSFTLKCKICMDDYPYAEPNQSDGTLICYFCRN